MDWEKRLEELSGYDISFEIKQGYYHVALVYDEGWDILSPSNELVYVEERNGVYHYIGEIGKIKMEDIFNSIESTIEYNMDLQRKLILFKEKTEELQELFATEDLEKLKKIKFIFMEDIEEKNVKKKKTTTKKEKVAKKEKQPKKTTKKTKKEEKKTEITNESEEKAEIIMHEGFYDNNDDVVTMSDNYFEELERK